MSIKIDKVNIFVTSHGNWFMIEIAQMFADGLQSNEIEVKVIFDIIPDKLVAPNQIQIVVAPHEFYPLFLQKEIVESEVIEVTKSLYFLTVEQPGSSWFEIGYKYSKYAQGIWDINKQAVNEFRRRGIKAIHTPLGYSPCLEAVSSSHGFLCNSIDILFLGVHSQKREMFLSKNANFFSNYNCKFIITRLDKPRLVSTPGFYVDAKRNELLSSSKILINIHSSDNTYLEWHRVLLAMANHCLVISESSEEIEPLVNGEHIIIDELDNISSLCQYYLENESKRLRIVENAYQFITQKHSSALLCKSLLENLNSK